MYPEEIETAYLLFCEDRAIHPGATGLTLRQLSFLCRSIGVPLSFDTLEYLKREFVERGNFLLPDVIRIVQSSTSRDFERISVLGALKTLGEVSVEKAADEARYTRDYRRFVRDTEERVGVELGLSTGAGAGAGAGGSKSSEPADSTNDATDATVDVPSVSNPKFSKKRGLPRIRRSDFLQTMRGIGLGPLKLTHQELTFLELSCIDDADPDYVDVAALRSYLGYSLRGAGAAK